MINFNKRIWEDGEVLYADDLNRIESGVDDLFNKVFLVKNVLVKSIKSVMLSFFRSAQYEVNSKELDFFFFWLFI